MKRLVLALATAVLAAGTLPSQSASAPDLLAVAQKKAAIIELLHQKASKALVTVAQDPAFSTYFKSDDHGHRHAVKSRIEAITLEVQSKFHVAEMCLIGLDGVEITRIVGRKIADDLSTEEASAIFFAPGFETPHRQVHISPIYVSPDVHKLVVAYVTPIMTEQGKKAILHYEHDLASFRQALLQGGDLDGLVMLVTRDDGRIIFDSRKTIDYSSPDGEADPHLESIVQDGGTMKGLIDRLGGNAGGTGEIMFDGARHPVAQTKAGRWTVFLLPENGL